MPMTVVNARVDAEDVSRARRVLEREGRTLSWAIRTTIEYIGRMGNLPAFALEEDDDAMRAARETTDFFESLSLVDPPEGWGDVELDRQIIDAERMERHG